MVAGANMHDTKLLQATIDAIVVKRPRVTRASPQNLCLDLGYDNPTGRSAAERNNYTMHIHRVSEERRSRRPGIRHRPRRWVVERTHAWLSKCRGILVRYEKKSENYVGM